MSKPNITIHVDKTISLEAAKLLGVAFTWGSCDWIYKYVPTGEGKPELQELRAFDPAPVWSDENVYDGVGITLEDDLIKDDYKYELYLVTVEEAGTCPK